MHTPQRIVLFAHLCACGLVTSAQAQDTPPLTLSASYSLQTDDNLARQPATAPDRADEIGTTTLGLEFHTIQGLQRFELQGSLVNYQYQHHKELNYTGRNYAAAWHWAVTPRVRGNLTGEQSEMPAAALGNTEPNQQRRSTYRADADYEIEGPWHLVAGVARDRVETQVVDATGTQFSANTVDAGVRYDASSGSFAKLSTKLSDGTYLNSNASPAAQVDDRYQQNDQDATVHWTQGANSSVDLYLTRIERRHPTYAQRDFSGLNYGASANWSLSAKTSLLLAYSHALAAYATFNTNYSEADQVALTWSWQTSAHTRLQVHHDYQQISYRGSPSAIAVSTRGDNNRNTRLGWIWQPRSQWQISAELLQLTRDSSEALFSYTSNQARITGQFSY